MQANWYNEVVCLPSHQSMLLCICQISGIVQNYHASLVNKSTNNNTYTHTRLTALFLGLSTFQTDNHASTSPFSFYRSDALPAAQPTASKHTYHYPLFFSEINTITQVCVDCWAMQLRSQHDTHIALDQQPVYGNCSCRRLISAARLQDAASSRRWLTGQTDRQPTVA